MMKSIFFFGVKAFAEHREKEALPLLKTFKDF